jgi:hypothetical protein
VGPVAAWFGAPPQRTLALTLRNTGSAPLTLPAFTLMRGRGSHPSTIVDSIELGTLDAGQTRTYRVPVRFDPVAIGTFTVRGAITSQGRPVAFKATTHAVPWGLLVVALGLAQLILVWVRNRGRAVLLRHEPVPGLEPLLAGQVDLLDYWTGRMDPAPLAPLALLPGPVPPVQPWSVSSAGVVAPFEVAPPTPSRSAYDVLATVAVPELPEDFRAAGPRHARRHAFARRDHRS